MRYDIQGYGLFFFICLLWYLVLPDTMAEIIEPITNFIYPAHILIFCRQFFRFDTFMFICLLISAYRILLIIITGIRSKVPCEIILFELITKTGVLYILAPFCAISSLFFFNITPDLSAVEGDESITSLHVIVLMFIYRDIIINDFLQHYKDIPSKH